MTEVVVGVDLGGTNIKVAAVTREKEILAKDSWPTNAATGPEPVIDTMAQMVEHILEKAGIRRSQLLAVGVGSPGPLNWQTGIIYETPNLPGWNNVPLTALMETRLTTPCFLENDANAACFGEYWLGAGQGCETMCVLTLGTGVGGGIVVFSRLLRGLDGTAGELGHMIVQRGGRKCGCGSHGCLESYASVTGLVRTATEGLEAGEHSVLQGMCGGDFRALTGKMVCEAAEGGDLFARRVFRETGEWLGTGIAGLINMLNPEKVILCGGMIAAGDLLFDPVRETAYDLAFEVPARRAQILPAGLGADSGVIGAAGCALNRLEARASR
jgi:glucokinase